jgi:hypothetical protein
MSRNVVLTGNNGHPTHPLSGPVWPSSECLEYRSAPDADIDPGEGLGFPVDMPEATQLPGMETVVTNRKDLPITAFLVLALLINASASILSCHHFNGEANYLVPFALGST